MGKRKRRRGRSRARGRSRGITSVKGMITAKSFKQLPLIVKAGAGATGAMILSLPVQYALQKQYIGAIDKLRYELADGKKYWPLVGSIALVWLAKKV